MLYKNTKEKPATKTFSLEVKDASNKTSNKVDVNVFEKIDLDKIARVVVWQDNKSRSGTHDTKDVSDLSYSTRKLRKQKGGGVARARNKGATQFRGGATVHGAKKEKIYETKLNKKERKLGLQHALGMKIQSKNIFVLKAMDEVDGTVKSFAKFLQKYSIATEKVLLVDVEKNSKISQSISNLYRVDFIPTIGLNVKSVVNSNNLILSEKALLQLKERRVL